MSEKIIAATGTDGVDPTPFFHVPLDAALAANCLAEWRMREWSRDAYAPNPFDPTKRGTAYQDLWQAAIETAAEDASAVAALLKDRDATIASLVSAIKAASGALQDARYEVQVLLAYVKADPGADPCPHNQGTDMRKIAARPAPLEKANTSKTGKRMIKAATEAANMSDKGIDLSEAGESLRRAIASDPAVVWSWSRESVRRAIEERKASAMSDKGIDTSPEAVIDTSYSHFRAALSEARAKIVVLQAACDLWAALAARKGWMGPPPEGTESKS